MSCLAAEVRWEDEPDPTTVRRMMEPIADRVPDGVTVVSATGGVFALGHLATTARWPRGTRPFADDRLGVVITADARLDNRAELVADLAASQAEVTDCELVMSAYQRWGERFPEYLVGDFAVVLWDFRRRLLLAARDPFGARALSYCQTPGGLLLATDVEQILWSGAVGRRPDASMVTDFLLWQRRYQDRTYFEDVRRLPAGHILVAASAGVRVSRHWRPPMRALPLAPAEDYRREFRRIFLRALDDRLDSDRPLVAHLSGGVDSSTIACAMNALYRDEPDGRPPVRLVGALYPGLACDEEPFMRTAASGVAFPLETWDATKPHLLDLKAPALAGPGLRSRMVSGADRDRQIARREGARVILGGLGGDQIGLPAPVMRDLGARRDLRRIVEASLLRPGLGWRFRLWRLGQAAAGASPAGLGLWRRLRSLRPRAVPRWLARPAREAYLGSAEHMPEEPEFLSHAQAAIWDRLASPRLDWSAEIEQRHASAHAVEARFPYLDARLARFVLALPVEHWLRPQRLRLHQEALADLMPPTIAHRTDKVEFTSAMRNQVLEGLGFVRDLLGGSDLASSQFIDRDAARSYVENVVRTAGVQDFSAWNSVWRMAAVEAWLRDVYRYTAASTGNTR